MSTNPRAGADQPLAKRAYATFAERYDRAAVTKPHNALYERPASLELVGDVAGLDVLDAGCGSGIVSQILANEGARVRAFDVTPEMVELARKRCEGLDVEIREADFTHPLDWMPDASVDRVLCSLALDYVEQLETVFREFARITRAGGLLVFSMSHPMRDWMDSSTHGGNPYFETNRWGTHWTGFGRPYPYVESYRRPLQDILNPLTASGWCLDRFVEPLPAPEMKTTDARHFAELSHMPGFICVRARK